MKQTEIDYRVLSNGRIEFTALRNVAAQNEIERELGNEKKSRYYHGRCYYTLGSIGDPNTVRIMNQHERLFLVSNGYRDYKVSETYSVDDWDFFIHFLKSAGERYTKIHHAKEQPSVMTVRI